MRLRERQFEARGRRDALLQLTRYELILPPETSALSHFIQARFLGFRQSADISMRRRRSRRCVELLADCTRTSAVGHISRGQHACCP